ncbi:PT domain-containing protein [Arthrobacter gengyunqii]|uniref:PT domain-containing protein n=1 Tax=Arthrobacter gengyunqii TaxID=2886940 RepID=A0ABS8GDQ8_9MICC|nr:PT domain-containing protein [Arthrobacter gengyunqii]MCC3264754.1 PT domain-containing protein [Arthrobacter gengyunqii]
MASVIPAGAADNQLRTYTAPEGAQFVWIDIEAPEVGLANTEAEINAGLGWTPITLKDTAFGLSAIVPIQPGQLKLRIDSSLRSDADLSLSYSGVENALIRAENERISLAGGTGPAPSLPPTPAPTDEPTGTPTAAPTDEPTGTPTAAPTDEPTGTPTAAPTDEPTGTPTAAPTDEPTPSSSPSEGGEDPGTDETTSPPSGPTSPSTADSGAGESGNTGSEDSASQASDRSGLPSTGWTPVLLFGAVGLLAAGAFFIAAARKKGTHQ